MCNFDNYTHATIDQYDFKSQIILNKKGKGKHVKSDSDNSDDELEALIARRSRRGKGKYKVKPPIIYFLWNKVGHIVARCFDKEDNGERKESK